MPHRPTRYSRCSTSPLLQQQHHHHQSSTAVNELVQAVQAVQRKLAITQAGDVPAVKSSPRRPSFSMNAILHHGKDRDHHKRADSKDREDRRHKRTSLTTGLRSTSHSKSPHPTHSPRLAAISPANFDVIIESPPLVFYGSTASSTGALLSGRLKLNVTDPAGQVRLTKLTMALNAVITTKKPVAKDCPECTTRLNDLNTWNFLSEPTTFSANENNQFPFSFLLPGHLPATTASSLASVTYHLEAIAATSHAEEIRLQHPLKIERAISPGPEKSSIRIFPPTNLTSRVVMPPVIHPIGNFPLQLILSGVVDKGPTTQTRWRLRKVTWRIEEHTKMISPPCPRHGHKVGGDGKALQHLDERTVGSDELKTGWKTDFDTHGGEITMELEARLSPSKHPICDMDSPAGLEVKHNLVIELIIAEEFCPNRNTSLITPTGAARVLRMQFALNVTERAGMGISWDEEMPPVYEDVPASPPCYGRSDKHDGPFGGAIMEDYDGPELEYLDLERMHTENPHDPPTYRERNPAEYAGVWAAMMRGSAGGGGGGGGGAAAASPSFGPSSPRFRSRTPTSNLLPHARPNLPHHGLDENDLVIEPPQFRISSDEGQVRREMEEDVAEGQTR